VAKKTSKIAKISQGDKVLRKLIIFASFITIYFNTNLQDPFNSPKMWIIMCVAGWLLAYLIPIDLFNRILRKNISISKANLFVIFFIISMFLSTIMTDVKYVALFGTEGRRLGFLTYLSLSLIMIAFIKYYSSTSVKLYYSIFVLSLLLLGYGYLQSLGQDFIKWNNPYNSIILTFGNPNFASAMLSILAAILVGASFDVGVKIQVKILMIFTAILMLVIIKNSNSRQGLIAFFIAFLFQICFYLYFKKKIIGRIFLAVAAFIFGLIIMAMLQVGPLVDLIYKKSVSIRGYYWRAAIEMFKSNPLFGVGIDRYGEYFKQYRESSYALTYGFEITSNNAHSVPLQLLATGGIFVGLSYLVLTLYIFYAGIKLILDIDTEHRNHIVAVFSGWIAFQAQSVISIDNIGLTIWGWILGGVILGCYQNRANLIEKDLLISREKISMSENLVRQLTSYLIVVTIVTLCSYPYRGETLALNNRSVYNPAVENNRIQTQKFGLEMVGLKLIDPNYRYWSANYLITSGYEDLGFKVLDNLITSDPRNLNYLNAKAGFLEQRKEYVEAIGLRIKIEQYDPWNARNILNLGRNYKFIENYPAASAALSRIMNFTPDSPISIEAKDLLSNG